MNSKTSSFWLLLGPGLLLASLLLLLYKASFAIASPVWVTGLSLTILISCAITYLSFREVVEIEIKGQRSQIRQETSQHNMRSLLNETHALYRDKIAKLEEQIASLEEEESEILQENEKEYVELQQGYEQLFQENRELKNRVSSFHTALEDALDEMRELKHKSFLMEELHQEIPKDLVHQHRTLREQFDEKALVLEQTRRRLFTVEGQLFTLKKVLSFDKLEEDREESVLIADLQELLEENERLEMEIALLEKLVSAPTPSKATKKAKKQLETMLEFQFDKPLTDKG